MRALLCLFALLAFASPGLLRAEEKPTLVLDWARYHIINAFSTKTGSRPCQRHLPISVEAFPRL